MAAVINRERMTNSSEEEARQIAMEEKEEDQYHYDPIHKLPDELLCLILMKLSDPKSLLSCSLVSKHFSSILSQSHSLSLQFSTPPKSSTTFLFRTFQFLLQITTLSRFLQEFKNNNNVFNEDTLLFRLTKLISPFTSLRSLRAKLPCSPQCSPCRANFQFSWVFDDSTKKLKTFAFLSMSSISKINDKVEEEEEEGSISEQPNGYLMWSEHLKGMASSSVRYATLINRTLLLLLSRHPDIQSVKIMDSEKHGEVSLQGDQLRKLKTNMSKMMPPGVSEETVMNMNLIPRRFNLWYAEKLRLPRSGVVVEGVVLGAGAVDRFPGDGGDIDGLVADCEDNGAEIFGEALAHIHTSTAFQFQRFCTIIHDSKLIVMVMTPWECWKLEGEWP